jgi:integrase
MGGTRTLAGVIIFVRMAFKIYQKKHARWLNPFQNLDPPRLNNGSRDALPEDEMLRLFAPGVLKTTMELAVCAAMFLSGLRRAEIATLRPENLDWHTRRLPCGGPGKTSTRKSGSWALQRESGNGMPLLIPFSRKPLKSSGKSMDGMNGYSVSTDVSSVLPGYSTGSPAGWKEPGLTLPGGI